MDKKLVNISFTVDKSDFTKIFRAFIVLLFIITLIWFGTIYYLLWQEMAQQKYNLIYSL
jgi:hypothetical protein